MKVGFLVKRNDFWKHFAPIADEGLRQGVDVECWHDYSQSRTGQKAHNFPAVESAPTFRHGKPRFRSYKGTPELQKLVHDKAADAIVSLAPPSIDLGAPMTQPSPVKWVMLQHALSSFLAYGRKEFCSPDAVGLYSNHWADLAVDYFREKKQGEPGDAGELQLKKRASPVGFPEMEAAKLIDRDEVRRRLGIPKDQPVVVYLPYSFGFGRSALKSWHLGLQPTIGQQIHYMARQRYTDFNLVRAVRTFCNRNGACLIVKARRKRPAAFYTKAMADRYLYDESIYPATILELLSIANLCIGFYSTTVHEAAYLGVPYLCIQPAFKKVLGDAALRRVFLDPKGGSFDFPGVSTVLDATDVISTLPQRSLSDFKMDAAARRQYITKFLGSDDDQSSKRVLNEIYRLIKE